MGKIFIKTKTSHPLWYSCICVLNDFGLETTTLYCCHEGRGLNSFDSLCLAKVKVNNRMGDMEDHKQTTQVKKCI